MSRGAPRGFSRGGGPPDTVLEAGSFLHSVEDEMFCASLIPDKVPYFNAPIYLQNKSVIGKVDEILGPINEVYFSVKMQEGMVASSFQKGDKVYIGSDKLLPIERFLPKPKTIGIYIQGILSAPIFILYRTRSGWPGCWKAWTWCSDYARKSAGPRPWKRYDEL
ncbi:Gar1/Naf1 RNA binding region-domain-containing protein [Scleroderma citrinum]